jgi:hypothetical protein
MILQRTIQRVLAWLRSGDLFRQRPGGDSRARLRLGDLFRGQPPGDSRDPYAWRPVPRRPQPKPRSGAVAVAEPDE